MAVVPIFLAVGLFTINLRTLLALVVFLFRRISRVKLLLGLVYASLSVFFVLAYLLSTENTGYWGVTQPFVHPDVGLFVFGMFLWTATFFVYVGVAYALWKGLRKLRNSVQRTSSVPTS